MEQTKCFLAENKVKSMTINLRHISLDPDFQDRCPEVGKRNFEEES